MAANGLEIQVQGQRSEELAKQLVNNLVIPQGNQVPPNQPSVKVEIDMDVVKRNQQQVDAGSSPWQLDPMQVAFTFATLQISPSGINGDPPIDFDSLKVKTNTGTDAVSCYTIKRITSPLFLTFPSFVESICFRINILCQLLSVVFIIAFRSSLILFLVYEQALDIHLCLNQI